MASFSEIIRNNPQLKRMAQTLIVHPRHARPRMWVRWLINPFWFSYGKKSLIRRSVRKDLFPFNQFVLGAFSVVEDFSTLNNGVGDIRIGKNTRIGLGSTLIGPVEIGDNVRLAQNIVLSGMNHNFENVKVPIVFQGISVAKITVGNDVWIGANAVVVAGVSIGEHSVIAAGSVVTKDIPPCSVAAGTPARVIKFYDKETGQWIKKM